MAEPLKISIEPPKMLSTLAERTLLQDALIRNPQSSAIKLRLARLLNKIDAHGETIDLLTDGFGDRPRVDAYFALIKALFAQNSRETDLMAQNIAESALAVAQTDSDLAQSQTELAKVKLRIGERDAAIKLLKQALSLNSGNVSSFKRLALEWLRQHQPDRVIALTDELQQRGVGHSRLWGARMLALAALGKTEAAQALLNASTFILETTVKPPSGWTSLDEFNADLSREITSNRDLRFERYGTSSAKAWRVDHPATDESSAVQALLKQIAEIAQKHAGQIAVGDHCWLAARPAKAELRSWCVMTESDGYERWHMHPDGWMSGGYYVEVPDGLADTHDKAGCLAFGLPNGLIGEAAAEAFGERLVRPKPGLLTLFPSHAYHRTYPHGMNARRMCAFQF